MDMEKDIPWKRELSCEVQRLTNGKGANKRIFLFDIRTEFAKGRERSRCTVDAESLRGSSIGCSAAVREDIQQCSLSGSTN